MSADEPELADIDDPRVTAARALIARIDKQKRRNDRTGSDLENRAIAGDLRDFISDTGAGAILYEIFHAEARDSGDDDASPSDPASAAAYDATTTIDLMRGVARVLQSLLPSFVSAPIAVTVLSEFLALYTGDASGLKTQSERDQTYQTKALRRGFVRLAWYRAGLVGGSWVDHLRDLQGLGKHTAQEWGDYATKEDKDLARDAGRARKTVGDGLPIPEHLAAIESEILKREARSVRTLHAKFKRGDFTPL
jgi:hypothetical protein